MSILKYSLYVDKVGLEVTIKTPFSPKCPCKPTLGIPFSLPC